MALTLDPNPFYVRQIAGIESIHAMNILDFDLDLLVVFDAVLDEGGISRVL